VIVIVIIIIIIITVVVVIVVIVVVWATQDPDMLQVGNVGLTFVEQRTHFAYVHHRYDALHILVNVFWV
jgi:hypothetical protein